MNRIVNVSPIQRENKVGTYYTDSKSLHKIRLTVVMNFVSVIIIAINAYSTKCGIRMANLFCVLKLGALFALTVLGAWKLGEGRDHHMMRVLNLIKDIRQC